MILTLELDRYDSDASHRHLSTQKWTVQLDRSRAALVFIDEAIVVAVHLIEDRLGLGSLGALGALGSEPQKIRRLGISRWT
jgi:hypothetical protein